MSVYIMGYVWGADLPRPEKLVLLAMADHADHKGRNVYPSFGLVAWKTGYNRRSVRRIARKLEKANILILSGEGPHGQNKYRINVDALPQRPDYLETVEETAEDKISGEDKRSEGVGQNVRGGRTQVSPKPSVNRSDNRQIPSGQNGQGRLPIPENGKETDHQLLMRLYHEALGYKIPHGGKEGAGAKKILKAGWSPEDAVACYRWLKSRPFWSRKHLSLMSVFEQLGPWDNAGRPGVSGASKPSEEETRSVNQKAMEKLRAQENR